MRKISIDVSCFGAMIISPSLNPPWQQCMQLEHIGGSNLTPIVDMTDTYIEQFGLVDEPGVVQA